MTTLNRVRRQKNFLLSYNKFSPAQKKLINANLTPDIIKAITEICVNIQKGVIPVKKSKLSKSLKQNILKLSKFNLSPKNRVKIVQKAGFIGPLLAAIAPVLIEILMNKVGKK